MIVATDKKNAVEAALVRNMGAASSVAGRTKRSAVRLAIVQAMGDGTLKPDDFLPPEKRLAKILGVSLGTVQAALQQLQHRGEIVRRSGYGSRVVSSQDFASSIWHFRLVDRATGKRLTFHDQRISIDTATGTGEWSAFLGEGEPCLRIARLMNLSNGALVAAEMFIREATAPRLGNIDPGELSAVNIRTYLQDEFGIVTARASSVVQCAKLEKRMASLLDCPPGTDALELHAKAYTHDGTPVYFQRIFARADSCAFAF